MINIAIVGFGIWGKKLYRFFLRTEEINVKWIYNRTVVDIDKTEIFTNNLEDVMYDKSLNIVFITTSVNSHFLLVEKLIPYQNLIVEKPTFHKFSYFEKINIELQDKLFTNYIFFYSKGINIIKDKIDLNSDGPFEISLNISQQNVNNDNVLNNLFCHVISIVIKLGLYDKLNTIIENLNENLNNEDYISISSQDKFNNSITLISDQRVGVSKKRYLYYKNSKASYYLDFRSDESLLFCDYDKLIPNNQSLSFFSERDNLVSMISASIEKSYRIENLTLSKKVMMVLDQIRSK
jgi:hypothetical protein